MYVSSWITTYNALPIVTRRTLPIQSSRELACGFKGPLAVSWAEGRYLESKRLDILECGRIVVAAADQPLGVVDGVSGVHGKWNIWGFWVRKMLGILATCLLRSPTIC